MSKRFKFTAEFKGQVMLQLEAAVSSRRTIGLREKRHRQRRTGTHRRTGVHGVTTDDGIGNRKKSLQLAGWDAAQKWAAAVRMQADYPAKAIVLLGLFLC